MKHLLSIILLASITHNTKANELSIKEQLKAQNIVNIECSLPDQDCYGIKIETITKDGKSFQFSEVL